MAEVRERPGGGARRRSPRTLSNTRLAPAARKNCLWQDYGKGRSGRSEGKEGEAQGGLFAVRADQIHIHIRDSF